MRITEPARPYRTFDDYRRRVSITSGATGYFAENPGKYPCLDCRGLGLVYDPEDPPDTIEGNKGRRRIKCQKCGGSRCGTKEELKAAYKEITEKYLRDKAEYQTLVRRRRSALRKLTKWEIAALAALGL